MKTTLTGVTLSALAALLIVFSLPSVRAQNGTAGFFNLTPQQLPTTATALCNLRGVNMPACGRDVWLCEGDVSAGAGTTATVTITDNQATPVPLWSAEAPFSSSLASHASLWVPASPNQDNTGCRYFPKGILVNASAAGIYIQAGGKW